MSSNPIAKKKKKKKKNQTTYLGRSNQPKQNKKTNKQ